MASLMEMFMGGAMGDMIKEPVQQMGNLLAELVRKQDLLLQQQQEILKILKPELPPIPEPLQEIPANDEEAPNG